MYVQSYTNHPCSQKACAAKSCPLVLPSKFTKIQISGYLMMIKANRIDRHYSTNLKVSYCLKDRNAINYEHCYKLISEGDL